MHIASLMPRIWTCRKEELYLIHFCPPAPSIYVTGIWQGQDEFYELRVLNLLSSICFYYLSFEFVMKFSDYVNSCQKQMCNFWSQD